VVAAERTLKGNGVAVPSPEQIIQQARDIAGRRELDRRREELPYVDAKRYIGYPLSASATRAVEDAAEYGEPCFPLPIQIDTGVMERKCQDRTVAA